MPARLQVSDHLLQRLSDWGIQRVFGYAGDGINAILGAFQRGSGGLQFVQTPHEEVAALMARLTEVGKMRERTDGAPIRRAMGNLRQVLQHRLTRDDVGNDTLLDVAAIIDEAAQKIERL